LTQTVFIGVGSNQGDKQQTIRSALELLCRHPQILFQRMSSLYRTEPVGFTEQDWFVNGALCVTTELEAEAMLDATMEIEQTLGRVRATQWGPRTIDLDLLFYGSLRLESLRLTLPHPRLHERRFVLTPLVEIAPDWVHPVLGRSMRELLAGLSPEGQNVQLWAQI
jgi:2-amino-4-hydroxy-6-hydroxymethyldihydropteridine diphosphokinase